MASAQSGPTATGLPPGVEVGPLGKRFAAHVIDSLVPAVISGVATGVALTVDSDGVLIGVLVVAGVLMLAWALLVWWMFAVRAAGPGMRLMKLQLVGFSDGRPIGWGRFLLRAVVLFALGLTGIGTILMLVFLVMHPRKQGWHDLAANSVVIKERVLPPSRPRAAAVPQQGTSRTPIESQRRSAPRPVATAPGPYQPQTTSAHPPQQPAGPQQPRHRGQPAPYGQQPAGPQQPRDRGQPTPYGQQPAPHSGQPRPRQATPPGPQQGTPGERGSEPTAPVLVPGPPSTLPPSETGDRAVAAQRAEEHRQVRTEWYVVLDDGRLIEVESTVLIGRNPQARVGEEDAQLIKISDEGRTVSKSHLAVGLNDRGLYVMDRGSTNGSTVTSLDGRSHRCTPGDAVAVEAGAIVSFGDHWLEVKRRPNGSR